MTPIVRGAALVLVACGRPPAHGATDVAGAMADASSDAPGDANDPIADALPTRGSFRGPLNSGPDPFLATYAGTYYLATTQGDAIRIWSAASLAELAVVPPVTIWQDTDPSRNRDVWAPALYALDGHWFIYYTADDGIDDHHRLYALEADAPLGPYHFAGKLEPPNATGEWAIDPVVLEQASGRYMLWSGAGTEGHNLIYIAPMTSPTSLGERVYLPSPGGCTAVREAPAILQRATTSFLVYSTCDTGTPDYQLWMQSIATSADPRVATNWHPHAGAMFARADAAGVYGPGSNAFFRSPDGSEDWIAYHAKNTAAYTYDLRTTRAQRITWTATGEPDLGTPLAPSATQLLPAGDPGRGTVAIDDTDAAMTFDGAWTAYPRCGTQCYRGGDHGSATPGATATIAFTGTQIVLISARDAGNGIAAISLDGGPETLCDQYAAIRQGEQINYVSPHVTSGPHVVTVRVTGQKSAASSGIAISIDRAEVYSE